MALQAIYDVPAPAKLNLFLHIVGRRSDGYHLLQSVFVLIDWADTLHFERRSDGNLRRHDLGETLPADDLCLRAARRLQAASGCSLGADISVLKQVPSGAGMGGGSSDAASTLLSLNRLWGLHWPRARLAKLGLALGADLPFFIGGNNALVQGVGERITALPGHLALPSAYAVVKPPTGIATPDIFCNPALKRDTLALPDAAILMGSFDGEPVKPGQNQEKYQEWQRKKQQPIQREEGLGRRSADPEAPGGSAEGGLASDSSESSGRSRSLWGTNDLQPIAESVCADVGQAARWLQARYGNSRMTGSGSAVFAHLGSSQAAVEVHESTQTVAIPMAAFPTDQLPLAWVGRMCLGLQQHPLRDWAD